MNLSSETDFSWCPDNCTQIEFGLGLGFWEGDFRGKNYPRTTFQKQSILRNSRQIQQEK